MKNPIKFLQEKGFVTKRRKYTLTIDELIKILEDYHEFKKKQK